MRRAVAGFSCPECGSRRLIRRDQTVRRFRTPPMGSKPVRVELAVQRVERCSCAGGRQVKVAFADERRSYTRAFELCALEFSRHMTILDVARHLGVGWALIKDIQKRYLKKRLSRPRLRRLRQRAIDEIIIGRGHRLLRLPDLHGTARGDQQQGQDRETTGLRLPRPRVLRARDPRYT